MRQRTRFALIFTVSLIAVWTVLGFLILGTGGCVSYKYDDCEYETTTTTERKLNCPSGKEGGTIIQGSRP